MKHLSIIDFILSSICVYLLLLVVSANLVGHQLHAQGIPPLQYQGHLKTSASEIVEVLETRQYAEALRDLGGLVAQAASKRNSQDEVDKGAVIEFGEALFPVLKQNRSERLRYLAPELLHLVYYYVAEPKKRETLYSSAMTLIDDPSLLTSGRAAMLLIQSNQKQQRIAAVRTLSKIISVPDSVLMPTSRGTWIDLRTEAVAALDKFSQDEAALAAPSLVECLTYKNFQIRFRCRQALSAVGATNNEVVARLKALESDLSVPQDTRINIPHIISRFDKLRLSQP